MPRVSLPASAGWCLPRSSPAECSALRSSSPARRAETLHPAPPGRSGGLRRPVPRSPAVSGESRSPVPARRCRPSWGQKELFPGLQALRQSPLRVQPEPPMQRALLSRSGWEQTAARQTQQCSPPQRMQSRFSEFPYYFSSFPFWCCGPHRSHPPTAEHHRRGHHLARRTARLLFWCSCIFLSHSACSASKLYSNAASRRQKCFKCHLYVYSIHPTPSSRQCPSVSHAGRFVEVFHHSRRSMWKTNQAAVLLHPKEKKMRSERDFCVFLLLS